MLAILFVVTHETTTINILIMKTLKTSLIVLGLIACSTATVLAGKLKEASLKLDVVIVEQRDGKILVGLKKKLTESVNINIYDGEGEKIYSFRVKKGELSLTRFDVSQLPDGEYTYEVTNRVYSEDKVITK